MGTSFNYIVDLLKQIIKAPSFSKQEDRTANIIETFFKDQGISSVRKHNNVWVRNMHFKSEKPTILLNSHHDTVQPRKDWTKDPFVPVVENDRLYGLGSNDAGASLVALIAAFLEFYNCKDLNYNIVFVASAEEEISGPKGIITVLQDVGNIDFGIVGEPTSMQMAVAEKGLMVLDCVAEGVSAHAARDGGKNAIYIASKDIEWIRTFNFPKVSEILGPVKMTVTMITSGTQHNVIPDICEFVVDVRSTDVYRNQEILEVIKNHLLSKVKERSTRLQPSGISMDHVIVKTAGKLGIKTFGSQTLSDQALMPFDSVKIGPGDSDRSHTADEFVYLREIKEGIDGYIRILNEVIK
jgi:acetylornithine deacetylase